MRTLSRLCESVWQPTRTGPVQVHEDMLRLLQLAESQQGLATLALAALLEKMLRASRGSRK